MKFPTMEQFRLIEISQNLSLAIRMQTKKRQSNPSQTMSIRKESALWRQLKRTGKMTTGLKKCASRWNRSKRKAVNSTKTAILKIGSAREAIKETRSRVAVMRTVAWTRAWALVSRIMLMYKKSTCRIPLFHRWLQSMLSSRCLSSLNRHKRTLHQLD